MAGLVTVHSGSGSLCGLSARATRVAEAWSRSTRASMDKEQHRVSRIVDTVGGDPGDEF